MMGGGWTLLLSQGRGQGRGGLHPCLGRNQCPAASAHKATRRVTNTRDGKWPVLRRELPHLWDPAASSQGRKHSQGGPVFRLLSRPHHGAPPVGTRGSGL